MYKKSAFLEGTSPDYGTYGNSIGEDLMSRVKTLSSSKPPAYIAKPEVPVTTSADNTYKGFSWDKDSMGAAAGLGSVLLQGLALPSQLKMAKTQRRALEQNMATAKEEQARRNRINNNIGNVRPSQPTSAFAGGS